MTFIEAVILAQKHGLTICGNPEEQAGEHDVCIYDESGVSGEFVGKLRWPNKDRNLKASVDEEVIRAIEKRTIGHDPMAS